MDDKLLEEMKKRMKKHRDECNEPTAWPPKDSTLKMFNSHGLKCAIVQNPHLGTINGYVLLPAKHPDAGKWYDDIDVTVHGGLTFCARDSEGGWWVGFDTAHAGDCVPSIDNLFSHDPSHIEINKLRGNRRWDAAAVIKETEQLASQFEEKWK